MVIETLEPLAAFDLHYSSSYNKRILFSGKFGSGKTYFLKEYFKNKEKTTNVFWLSPVKYSVGLNEDIFEYIKFDLALKLIGMAEFAPSVKKRFGEELYIHQFLSNQPMATIDTLLVLMETIAKGTIDGESLEVKGLAAVASAKKVADDLMNYYKKYKTFKEEIDKASASHSELFKKYLETSVLKRGSIFENDLVTQTIKSAIEVCKYQSNKENILVIDDFDRLDPEHVFRILNILSVHNDVFEEDNKFGFDKIIVVCDYDNIENIYKYKYGSDVNFYGYICKFFSTEVFHFNNRIAIQNFCRSELSETVRNKNDQEVLGLLLAYFVEKNVITMRDIIKADIAHFIYYKSFKYGPYNIWGNMSKLTNSREVRFADNRIFIKAGIESFYLELEDFPFIQAIRVLCVIFGGYNILKDKITDIDHNKDIAYDREYALKIIKSIAPLIHMARNYSEPTKLFFKLDTRSHAHYTFISGPSVDYFGIDVPIPTGWSSGNTYKGDVSYYTNVSNLLKVLLDDDNFNYKDKIEAWGSYKLLLSDISKILEFLDESGTFQRLGVTK